MKCNTIDAYFDDVQAPKGLGGNGGINSNGCPYGYFGVGKQCFYFANAVGPPTAGPAIYTEAMSACSAHNGDVLYIPIDVVQNAVVKAALQLWVSSHIYLKSVALL